MAALVSLARARNVLCAIHGSRPFAFLDRQGKHTAAAARPDIAKQTSYVHRYSERLCCSARVT